jgi:hypothetical protein
MTSTNSNTPFWKIALKKLIQTAKLLQRQFAAYSLEYPDTVQVIQLSFIYFFAFVDLLFGILSNVLALGDIPMMLQPFMVVIKAILTNPFFQFWNSPEKIFFISYLVIEVMVTRSIFKFSKLLKYNILLLFALLMIQGLVIAYWDVMFHREVCNGIGKWVMDDMGFIYTDHFLAYIFFFLTFLIFISLYTYLYIRAINNKFATLPGAEWLTDSIAFWVKIKTPTMRIGFRKNKGGPNS